MAQWVDREKNKDTFLNTHLDVSIYRRFHWLQDARSPKTSPCFNETLTSWAKEKGCVIISQVYLYQWKVRESGVLDLIEHCMAKGKEAGWQTAAELARCHGQEGVLGIILQKKKNVKLINYSQPGCSSFEDLAVHVSCWPQPKNLFYFGLYEQSHINHLVLSILK